MKNLNIRRPSRTFILPRFILKITTTRRSSVKGENVAYYPLNRFISTFSLFNIDIPFGPEQIRTAMLINVFSEAILSRPATVLYFQIVSDFYARQVYNFMALNST